MSDSATPQDDAPKPELVEAVVAEVQQGKALPDFQRLLGRISAQDAWHLMRRTGIGGSDVAAILGLNPWRAPIDVYLDKIGESKPWDGNEATKWGKLLEPVIATEYQSRNGGPESCHLDGPFEPARVEARPWHLYTVDRLVLSSLPEGWTGPPRAQALEHIAQDCGAAPRTEPPAGLVLKVLEIKARGWMARKDYGDEDSDEIPFGDLCQVAWYVSALDVNGGADVAALFNTNELRVFHYYRDTDLEDQLLEAVHSFWFNHVVARVPPPADGTKGHARYIRERFDKNNAALLQPTEPVLELAGKLRMVVALIKSLGESKELLQQQLQEIIGEAAGIDLTESGQGRMLFKFDKRGKVNHSAVAEELAARLKLGPKALKAVQDQHLSKAPRVFRPPYWWRKDQLVEGHVDVLLSAMTDKLLAAKKGELSDAGP